MADLSRKKHPRTLYCKRWWSKYNANEPVALYWELRGRRKCEGSEQKVFEIFFSLRNIDEKRNEFFDLFCAFIESGISDFTSGDNNGLTATARSQTSVLMRTDVVMMLVWQVLIGPHENSAEVTNAWNTNVCTSPPLGWT